VWPFWRFFSGRDLAIQNHAPSLAQSQRMSPHATLRLVPMKTQWAMIGIVALLLTACVAVPGTVPGVVIDPADPYYYSPTYCVGCWYGQWGGRIGYHRGGGRPWERPHTEADHHGENRGRDVMHEDIGETVPLDASRCSRPPFFNAPHAARCVACHGVRSHLSLWRSSGSTPRRS